MTHWTRKSLDDLRFSIGEELNSMLFADKRMSKLMSVKNQIAMNLTARNPDIAECRSKVCEVCRKYHMYQCDEAEGWTPTCALVKRHTGES
jgi:hypothetical protein